MKNILYIILISALIPATMMLCMTFIGFYFALQNTEISLDFFIVIFSMALGICGYVGLILLLEGLYKTKHHQKITFLSSGLIGFTLFMIYVSPRNFVDWLIEYDIENLIGKWPLIVSLLFLILTTIDLIKNKTLTNNN
jgi:hypothetical protein